MRTEREERERKREKTPKMKMKTKKNCWQNFIDFLFLATFSLKTCFFHLRRRRFSLLVSLQPSLHRREARLPPSPVVRSDCRCFFFLFRSGCFT